jgi:hypothetical protein
VGVEEFGPSFMVVDILLVQILLADESQRELFIAGVYCKTH